METAVITGGSSGIGAELARQLARRGWLCVLLARGRERLDRLARETGAEAEVCDVSDRDAVDRVAGVIAARHPRIRLLVNNAGIPAGGGFLELEPERIEEVVRINYLGGVWCLRAFLPLLEAGAPSGVVNVASVAGSVAYGPSGPYTAAKHAQLAFSRSVAAELAPRGILVHSVSPGLTATEGFPQTAYLRGRWTRRLVMKPERVASVILKAVERSQPEVFVPCGFRLAAVAQAAVPGTLTRLAARRARNRG